jgi:hypothetical protein
MMQETAVFCFFHSFFYFSYGCVRGEDDLFGFDDKKEEEKGGMSRHVCKYLVTNQLLDVL